MKTNRSNIALQPLSYLKLRLLALLILLSVTGMNGFAKGSEGRSDSSRIHLQGVQNLTSAQKTKIKELRTQIKKEVLPIANQMSERKAHLRTLETAEKTDLPAINSTIDELQTLHTKMMKLKAALKQEIRKILTTEQRLDFDTRSVRDHKHRPHKGHGRHGRSGDE